MWRCTSVDLAVVLVVAVVVMHGGIVGSGVGSVSGYGGGDAAPVVVSSIHDSVDDEKQ